MTINKIILKQSFQRGVAWSSGQHRRLPLQGSAVRISALPLSFISRKKNRKTTKESRQEEIENVQERSRRSGEKKKKNRQADQEWLRERLSVRFEDD